MKRKTFYTILLFTFIFAITSFFACKKNNNEDTIPNIPVSFTVYLSLPQYVNLNSVGGYVKIPEYGYRGIIIYRRSLEEFVSYDLACPYDVNVNNAKINVDSSGITMIDPQCGSKFSLYDGSVQQGPATRPLKMYNSVYESSSNSVYISN